MFATYSTKYISKYITQECAVHMNIHKTPCSLKNIFQEYLFTLLLAKL